MTWLNRTKPTSTTIAPNDAIATALSRNLLSGQIGRVRAAGVGPSEAVHVVTGLRGEPVLAPERAGQAANLALPPARGQRIHS